MIVLLYDHDMFIGFHAGIGRIQTYVLGEDEKNMRPCIVH
jgi:hypothetical protein